MAFTKETAALPRASKHQGPAQEARQRMGLTQAQMAEKLGVSVVQWQRWEKGTSPFPKTAELAIKYLEMMQDAPSDK